MKIERELIPGLYRHFKGGLYYALCEAYDHESDPDHLTGAQVVYYSYEKDHWRRRPSDSPESVPDQMRDGFFDLISRPGYAAGTARFQLIQAVPAHVAMRGVGPPWIPVLPGEQVRLHDVTHNELMFPPGDRLRQACLDFDKQVLTVSAAKQMLGHASPGGGHVGVVEGRYLLALRLPPDQDGVRYQVPLMRFERGPDFPPPPVKTGSAA